MARGRPRKQEADTFFGRWKSKIRLFNDTLKEDRTPLAAVVLIPILIWLLTLRLPYSYWGIETWSAIGIDAILFATYSFYKLYKKHPMSELSTITLLVAAVPALIISGLVLVLEPLLSGTPQLLYVVQAFLIINFSYLTLLFVGIVAWVVAMLFAILKKTWRIAILVVLACIASWQYQFLLNLALSGSGILLGEGGLAAIAIGVYALSSNGKKSAIKPKLKAALLCFVGAFILIWLFRVATITYPVLFSANTMNSLHVQIGHSITGMSGQILHNFIVSGTLSALPILTIMLIAFGIEELFMMIINI